MAHRWQLRVVVVTAAGLLAGCGGSGGTAASSDPDPDHQVQVATSEGAREDTANVSARLKAAGYNVLVAAPVGSGPGGFAVLLGGGGGVIVVLVLDSASQADAVGQGFKQSSPSSGALVQQLGKHVYAANTGTTGAESVSKADFDKVVAAGEAA